MRFDPIEKQLKDRAAPGQKTAHRENQPLYQRASGRKFNEKANKKEKKSGGIGADGDESTTKSGKSKS